MKKIVLGIAMASLLMVSLASAGLVDFLSNQITGTIEINGPIFYLTSGEKLSVNEIPSSAGTPYTIIGDDNRIFETEEYYNGMDFYKPTIKFVVDLEINNFTNPRGLNLDFGYYNKENNRKTICSVSYISITKNEPIELNCPFPEDIDLDKKYFPNTDIEGINEFYFEVQGLADNNIEYKIKKKTSYVQITGARQ